MKQLKLAMKVCLICLLSSCAAQKMVAIQRAKLIGNFNIEFVNKNITIKPDEFFKPQELGLVENMPTNIGTLENALNLCIKKRIKNYDIIIKNPAYPKPYYGKIAFFKTPTKNKLAAVSRYYELSIGDSYFENATRGRMGIVYEYFDVAGKTPGLFSLGLPTAAIKVPTWFIILSDEPL